MSLGIGIYEAMEASAVAKELTGEAWAELRRKAQAKVMKELPPELLGKYRDPEAKKAVKRLVLRVVESNQPTAHQHVKQTIVERLVNDISGYGPLEKYLDDPDITEIIVERWDKLQIEEHGALKPARGGFESEEHLRLVLERIIAPLGERLDWASPVVHARLPDGSRVCALIPPVTPAGAQVVIRKFRPGISMNDLVKWDTLPAGLARALAACVKGRLNIMVSGGTGSGKTTLLNALSEYIQPDLSIITIEKPIEMQLKHPHVRQWEARSANIEDKGEISVRFLVETALRSRPDIIIIGEVRGAEAYDLLNAMSTGHPGSMSTLHADDTAQAMDRLVAMATSAKELPGELIPGFAAEAIDLVVHATRMGDKKRRVVEVSEVIGVNEKGKIKVRPLVTYKVDQFSIEGIEGHWETTGAEFSLVNKLQDQGIKFPGWLGDMP